MRPSSIRFLLLTSVALTTVAVACGHGSGSGGGGGGGAGPYGGTLLVSRFNGVEDSVTASFVSEVAGSAGVASLAGDPFGYIPLGQCITFKPAVASTTLKFTFANAGPSVVVESSSTTVTLDGAAQDSYSAGVNTMASGVYQLVIGSDGSMPAQTISAVTLPEPAAVTLPTAFASGNFTFPGSTPLVVKWVPRGGTATVLEFFEGGATVPDEVCRSDDSGSFTITSAGMAGIAPSGYLVMESYAYDTRPVAFGTSAGTRSMVMSAVSAAYAYFTKD
jgi:hypothetical protein